MKTRESKCTFTEYDKFKVENSFAIFHKNSLVKILAEDLTNIKEKWVFLEIEARNKIDEINYYYDTVDYNYDFIDFFIG